MSIADQIDVSCAELTGVLWRLTTVAGCRGVPVPMMARALVARALVAVMDFRSSLDVMVTQAELVAEREGKS